MFYLIKCCNLRSKKRTSWKLAPGSGHWVVTLRLFPLSGRAQQNDRDQRGRVRDFLGPPSSLFLSQSQSTIVLLGLFSVILHSCSGPLQSAPAFQGSAAMLVFESWLKNWEIQKRSVPLLWKYLISFLSVPDSFSPYPSILLLLFLLLFSFPFFSENTEISNKKIWTRDTWLAHLAECETLDFKVVNSTPTLNVEIAYK